ncbi:hypothetical protein TNCV_3532801 [Trichonephila clavipes]|nr:hypothetical protein TNCV_3532801 [Trichonephila clavipes]
MVFQTCPKCHLLPASPEHILDCLGLALEDVHATPLLVLDFVMHFLREEGLFIAMVYKLCSTEPWDYMRHALMNKAAPDPASSETRNIMKSKRSYLHAHSNSEMNNNMDNIEFDAIKGM